MPVLSILLIQSCGGGKGTDMDRRITDNIAGHAMFCKDLVGNNFIGVAGDTVIMEYYRTRQIGALFLADGDTLTKVKDFLYRGRGPNELMNPVLREEEGVVYAIDRTGYGPGKMLKIPVKNICSADGYAGWEEDDLTWCNPMSFGAGDFLPLDNGKLLISGDEHGKENLLTIIDVDARTRYPLGYWISDDNPASSLVKQSLYEMMTLFRNGERILYVCGEGRYMEFLDISGGKIASRKAVYTQFPEYVENKDGINYNLLPESYRGIRVCTTERYVYAVLCGQWKYPQTYKGYPGDYMDEIEVYDWDGNFIKKYQTSIPFNAMAISDDDRTLYTLSVDLDTMEPQIVRYDLISD